MWDHDVTRMERIFHSVPREEGTLRQRRLNAIWRYHMKPWRKQNGERTS